MRILSPLAYFVATRLLRFSAISRCAWKAGATFTTSAFSSSFLIAGRSVDLMAAITSRWNLASCCRNAWSNSAGGATMRALHHPEPGCPVGVAVKERPEVCEAIVALLSEQTGARAVMLCQEWPAELLLRGRCYLLIAVTRSGHYHGRLVELNPVGCRISSLRALHVGEPGRSRAPRGPIPWRNTRRHFGRPPQPQSRS